MAKSAAQMQQNWLNAMASGTTTQKYTDGIKHTTVNPMALAATDDAERRYMEATARSVTSGKRTAKLMAVPVNRWKDNAVNIGAQRLSTGAQGAKDKVAAHFQKWQPIYQQVHDVTHAMPKGGAANAKARVNAAIDILMGAAGRT